jgi:hypothetical protein
VNIGGFLYPHLINGDSITFCSIPPIRQGGLDIFCTIFSIIFNYVKSEINKLQFFYASEKIKSWAVFHSHYLKILLSIRLTALTSQLSRKLLDRFPISGAQLSLPLHFLWFFKAVILTCNHHKAKD